MSANATKSAPAKPASVGAPIQVRYIQLLVLGNPKKPGSASAARFGLYVHGMSTSAYQEAVTKAGQPKRLAAADLLWDVRHGFISLHATSAQVGAAPKAKAS
jgi:hypothetical protein